MTSPGNVKARRQSIVAAVLTALIQIPAHSADPVFSGPQAGEAATPFKVLNLTGEGAGNERQVNPDAATALVFVQGMERSLVPLLRVVDQYGAARKERIKTEVVFLFADRLAGEQRAKAVAGSLKLQSRVSLSLDGIEGPGNYGLNKECLMTIVVTKDGKVTDNFALVQPGIADAPKVVAALARTFGDDSPPSIEQLSGRPAGREGADRPMRPAAAKGKDPFPGAVPADEKLVGLLRRFIRPTNDDATVDQVLQEVRAHIKGNAELRKQAIDGWTRVLHFGDHYGTEYSRKVGRAFLEELQREGTGS
jgi:hypothetical protein